MIRLALMLAIGSLQGACTPGSAGNNSATGDQSIVATHSEASTPARELDQGTASTMSKMQILIASDQGDVTAELVDNAATQELLRMLPVTIEMRDHLRQEKTGNLPSPLPEVQRQTDYSVGTLGLWGNDDFVVYYRTGRVPAPGISIIGRVIGDVTIFNDPGPVTVRIARAD
jgi:hypothetical protein